MDNFYWTKEMVHMGPASCVSTNDYLSEFTKTLVRSVCVPSFGCLSDVWPVSNCTPSHIVGRGPGVVLNLSLITIVSALAVLVCVILYKHIDPTSKLPKRYKEIASAYGCVILLAWLMEPGRHTVEIQLETYTQADAVALRAFIWRFCVIGALTVNAYGSDLLFGRVWKLCQANYNDSEKVPSALPEQETKS